MRIKIKYARSLVILGATAVTILMGQACGRYGAQDFVAPSSSSGAPDVSPVTGHADGPATADPPTSGVVTCRTKDIQTSHHRTEVRGGNADVCLVVSNIDKTPGTPIVAYDCAGRAGNPFRPVLDPTDCSFQIQTMPLGGTLCLDAGAANATKLVQQPCDSSSGAQKWDLVPNSDSTYALKSRDNRCVTRPAGDKDYGPIRLATCDGSPVQLFRLPGLAEAFVDPPVKAFDAPVPTPKFGKTNTYLRFESTMVARSAQITSSGVGNDVIWSNPRPGAFIEYDVDVERAGDYSLQMIYSAWLPGAATQIYVNGRDVGRMPYPANSPDAIDNDGGRAPFEETPAFPLKLVAGPNTIRLALPPLGMPYRTAWAYLEQDGEELTKAGFANPVAAAGRTDIDIAAVNRLYRFTLDQTLGVRAWRYPHNVAHLEYKLEVAKAGRYLVQVTYSSGWAAQSLNVFVNGPLMINVGAKPVANIPMPITGPRTDNWNTGKTFEVSTGAAVELPAGTSRLDLSTAGFPTEDFAIAGVHLTPVP